MTQTDFQTQIFQFCMSVKLQSIITQTIKNKEFKKTFEKKEWQYTKGNIMPILKMSSKEYILEIIVSHNHNIKTDCGSKTKRTEFLPNQVDGPDC